MVAFLFGEALLFGSTGILIWALAFVALNQVFFVFYEEPNLERLFGQEYRDYKSRVPRWIPRPRG